MGIQYLIPLVDSVGLGDRLRLYRNATRFYYFMKSGSLVPVRYLRSGFMLCHLGVHTSKYAMSAGTYAVLNTFVDGGFTCTLPSGLRKILRGGYNAIVGRYAAPLAYKQYFGKASAKMYPRSRIIVRSCAKNPVDHPNGGRTRGKTLIKTPWGHIARAGK
jgi:large subunit ribosomal protein L2